MTVAEFIASILNTFLKIKDDIKLLRNYITGSNNGNLTGLNTTNKSSIIAAVNEVKSTADSASVATGHTNLTLTRNATSATIFSDTGTDAVISLADTNAGLLSPAEKTKLATVLLSGDNLSGLANTATARSNIGLGNVDNTTDANKPISTATQTALNLKADKSEIYTKTELGNPDTDLVALWNAA